MHALIIDGLNLIRRVHAGVTGGAGESDAGAVANACEASLRKLLARRAPSHAMCIVDSAPPSWRHREFPGYKASRAAMPADLAEAMTEILARFEACGVGSFSVDGFEADDVIASVAGRVADAGGRVTIVSTDKSFCQLLSDRICVYDYFADRYLDRQHVVDKYGVEPRRLVTLFALAGDSSVDVPGVRSIGPRTAAKLIDDYGELDDILAAAENMTGHVGDKLRAGLDDARLAARLLALRLDVNTGLNLKDFRLEAAAVNR